ncbi:hypothetical protein ILYODFUR_006034 [Ilyodon furcidens]|uniref:CRAL-TRIO domain-containing protein n=1 Tax=Ilyodon furcidens TaxID=33524 RepID=A0ABV0VD26_9TELE
MSVIEKSISEALSSKEKPFCLCVTKSTHKWAGYYSNGVNAIIVFAACFLPDSAREDYHEIMENLFLYVISTLELMVAEDYMIVYLNGATPHRRMPGLGWLKKCYQMIDRRWVLLSFFWNFTLIRCYFVFQRHCNSIAILYKLCYLFYII